MNPRERAAFAKGTEAAERGKSVQDNPYTHETSIQSANFWAWRHGFDRAVTDARTERGQ